MQIAGRQMFFAVAAAAFFLTVAPLEAEIVQKCVNKADGFSIEFPAGWELKENPAEGVSLVAFRPKEKPGESVYERLEIVSLRGVGEDGEDFLEKRIADLSDNLTAFALVARGREDPIANSLTYTFTDTFFTLKVLAKAKQWIFQRGDRIYILTARATVKSFPKYEEAFGQIAGGFQLLK